ncbi:MAG: hypothetical protein ISR76_09900, partial [Planctomycetes bacterium]|nr:hypothetical protein [Planctomycetota bacterium]
MRFVLPLVLSLTSSLSAQALDETLAAAEELASTGNYLAARQSLMDAVAGASDRGEVLARLGPIQERLADWAFYAQFPGAGPSDLFHGEVKSFKESGLKIRMVYAWEELTAEQRLDDFFQAEGQWFFRAPLTGDLKFSLEGTWPAEPESIALLVGFDEAGASGWKFSPGFKRTKKSPPLLQPRRLERVGSPFEVFLTATDKLDEPDGDWAYSAELRRSTFSFKRGSRKIGSWETSHPDLTDGYLGFSGVGVKEIDFSGQLDPDLWANRSREMVDQRRKKFVRQEYDFGADMPAWFADMKASSDSRPPFRAPDGVPEAARAAWQELLDPDAKIVLPEWSAE